MSEEQKQRRARQFLSRVEREIEANDFRYILREDASQLGDSLSLAEGLRSPLYSQAQLGGRPARSIPQSPPLPDTPAPAEDEFTLTYASQLSRGATLRRLFSADPPTQPEPGRPAERAPPPGASDPEDEEEEDEEGSPGAGRGRRRFNKGLKLLSVVVRDIVVERQSTTYKEVADVILRDSVALEGLRAQGPGELAREEQNIKRRVYDALNVLISAGVLIKEGKRVRKNEVNKKIKVNMKRMETNSLRSRLVR